MKKYIHLVLVLFALLPLAAKAQTINVGSMPGNVPAPAARKELLIPNAFSPNNDGQNDYFKVCNITNEKLIDFKVFNRWGTILFRTTDAKQGWDGTYKGQVQPLGVYGYVIRIGYPDGYVETYKGTVTLIR
ncbi:gliding motility-associated C-terminal domain-containing protein [Taibaiella koreensis]|uniref:gliding motility-associated C-terminal domain-containing protein n=1 Tax=Taibaiella koreensis TaxID=1268548 RepID=UPI000E59ACD0|nr:gliding motility-associated C-terminal domain-containing protein [Taibaiella koreensis]